MKLMDIRDIIEASDLPSLERFYLFFSFALKLFFQIPFSCIQFPLYESLKSIYYKKFNQTHASPLTCSLFGCVSGVTAAALTTPLDVIKTRVMLTNEKKIAEVINEIYKERGFFKGLAPRW